MPKAKKNTDFQFEKGLEALKKLLRKWSMAIQP